MTPPAPRSASASELQPVDTAADLAAPAVDVDVDDERDSDAPAGVRVTRPREPRDPAVAPPAPADQAVGLNEREQRILVFEKQWWKHAGAKEQAIRDQFEISSTRYYQAVNKLLDNPAALAFDPVLVRRLRRLRATRTRARRSSG